MKLFKKVMAAAALAALACSPAHAIERIGWSQTRETMYVHGLFEPGDAQRIFDAIQANRRTLRGIIFNSGGGLVSEGYKLARLIRRNDYDTGIARNGMCASACFMVWATGRNRYAYANSAIGVHSVSMYNSATDTSGENDSSFVSTMEMARLYDELNVPSKIVGKMVTTKQPAMYWLSMDDTRSMNVQIMN